MNPRKARSEGAANYLNDLLCRAVEAGADTLELERVPGGLEITWLAGGSCVGIVLQDAELEAELIGLIVRNAGLERRAKGKMQWNIQGKDREITVEEYDSFGESCFRLKLGKAPPAGNDQ
jgi:hypothetical protein